MTSVIPRNADIERGHFKVTINTEHAGISLCAGAPARLDAVVRGGIVDKAAKAVGINPIGCKLMQVNGIDVWALPAAKCKDVLAEAPRPLILTLEPPAR